MRIGIAHSAGKYSWPAVTTTQFTDGCNEIYSRGFRTLKVYCTSDYVANYPLHTWSSTPTSLKTLAQVTEYAAQLARTWHTVFMTCFTFANGSTNWWRAQPLTSAFEAEYTEMYDLACHLLSTYNGTGRRFVLQNWEGDWAFMDSFTVETHVDQKMVDRYVQFLGTRQRAVEAARRTTPSDCLVLHAVEANRVVDARLKPHLRRICRDVFSRVRPDVVNYSAYDGTIVDQGGWGADLTAWTAATTPVFTKALRTLKAAFPGVPLMIGEFGFPEGAELPVGRNVGDMINVVHAIALSEGVDTLIYWQVFDNEETSPSVPRGFYIVKPDGSSSQASSALVALI